MSFVILYKLPRSKTHRCLSLTGVIGKDTQLYWLLRDVLEITWSRHRQLSTVRVRDVMGPSAAGDPRFLKRRVVTHVQACKLLGKARRVMVRRFAERLNSPRTWVNVVVRNDPGKEPTLLRLLDPEEVAEERHDLFFVWYVFFRKRVAEELYGCDLLNGRSVVDVLEEKGEGEKFVFPASIVVKHEDRSVKYVREPE